MVNYTLLVFVYFLYRLLITTWDLTNAVEEEGRPTRRQQIFKILAFYEGCTKDESVMWSIVTGALAFGDKQRGRGK